LATLPEDLIAASALVAEMQGRIQPDGTGFSDAELMALQGVGLDSALCAVVALEILNAPVSADPLGDVAAASAALSAVMSESVEGLEALANAASDEVAQLLPSVASPLPVADAGGHYAGGVGTPISLNATGTSDPDTPPGSLTFSWDADGDADFDDASGITASFTYTRPFDGLVAVLVEDPEGNTDTGYARIVVSPINSPPAVLQTPTALSLRGSPGTQFDFSVAVDDIDGDSTTVTWWLNDDAVETGLFYSHVATVADIGLNRVRALASDGQPSTPDGLAEWIVMVAHIPIICVEPEVLDFGVTLIGSNVSRMIEVRNDGTVDQEITNLELVGDDRSQFTIVFPSTPISIPAERMTQIGVRFEPDSMGAKSASVVFESSDVGNPYIRVTLNGVGTTMGDADGDGDSDLQDFSIFVACIEGSDTRVDPMCEPLDYDHDGRVDLADFAEFSLAFNGNGG
jgi:hypothetical protein